VTSKRTRKPPREAQKRRPRGRPGKGSRKPRVAVAEARDGSASVREASATTAVSTGVLACPHFPPCAGCPLIPVPYAEQLDSKRTALIEALRPFVPADVAPEAVIHPTVAAPRFRGYRNQLRLVFRRMSRGGQSHIGLGMYVPGTHRVVHIPYCPIQPEKLNAVAATFVRLAEEMQLDTYDERTGTGTLRYLALRTDRGRKHVLATVIVGDDPGAPLRKLAERVRAAHPEVVGVTLHRNARHSNVLFAGEDVWVIGAERLEDRVGRFSLYVSPRSFLQVNHMQAEWVYERLETVLGGASDAPAHADVVLDLYCGVGGIALHLARPGRLTVGVEAFEEAVDDARRAADRNGVAGVRFVAADVATFLRSPASFGVDLGNRRVTGVVLNPPRAGCDRDVMEAVAALEPERIAYVSCRPFSLGRDLEFLRGGWEIEAAWPVDMIPLTHHVESLTVLRRRR
jgi:23S rRNA (uracil1939-C5)-methyltransferase